MENKTRTRIRVRVACVGRAGDPSEREGPPACEGADNQGGARGAVADRVDVLRRGGDDRRAGREVQADLGDDRMVLRDAREAHGKEHEVRLDDFLRVRHARELERLPLGRERPFDLFDLDARDLAIVAEKLDRVEVPAPRAAFVVAGARTEHVGPERPRRRVAAFGRGLGHDLDLRDALRALADRRANAVGPRVAAADDEHLLALGGDGKLLQFAREHAVLSAQQVKREVDAFEFAARNLEVAGSRRADREHDGVVRLLQIGGGDVRAHRDAGDEGDAFGLENRAAAVDDGLVELETGNAVAEQAADVLVLFVDRHLVAAAAKGDRGGESGGARADDGDGLAVLDGRRTGHDPAVRESRLDDVLFRLADHHRLLVQLVDAARLAERGADPGGELREVGVHAQELVGPLVVAFRDGLVLVRHQVAQRAAVAVAEGLPAVHAAGDLLADVLRRNPAFDLLEVVLALIGVAVDVVNAFHGGKTFLLEVRDDLESPDVLELSFDWHDHDELRTDVVPVAAQALRLGGAGALDVLVHQGKEVLFVVRARLDWHEVDRIEVRVQVERTFLVVDVGDAARHARREVDAGRAEHQHLSAGHILAAVVADALGDERDARVADAEAFAGLAVHEDLAGGSAVGHHVAGDHVVLRRAGEVLFGLDGDDAAGEALADVVVRGAPEVEGDAVREERAEGLSADTREVHGERAVRQAVLAPLRGDLARELRADRAVDVRDGALDLLRLAAFDEGQEGGEEFLAVVVLKRPRGDLGIEAHVGAGFAVEDRGEVEAFAAFQQVGAADGLVERLDAERGELFTNFLREEAEVVLQVLHLAGEVLPQLLGLCGDADGAGVEVAVAALDAAEGDEHRGAEAELLRAEHRADHDVAAGAELSVHL